LITFNVMGSSVFPELTAIPAHPHSGSEIDRRSAHAALALHVPDGHAATSDRNVSLVEKYQTDIC
jgi:hypothetical protein